MIIWPQGLGGGGGGGLPLSPQCSRRHRSAWIAAVKTRGSAISACTYPRPAAGCRGLAVSAPVLAAHFLGVAAQRNCRQPFELKIRAVTWLTGSMPDYRGAGVQPCRLRFAARDIAEGSSAPRVRTTCCVFQLPAAAFSVCLPAGQRVASYSRPLQGCAWFLLIRGLQD